jgi:CTP synthase (UTP-ammonia lyase)
MAAPALAGDSDPSVPAHRAIPLALGLARAATPSAAGLTWQWIATRDLTDAPRDLAAFSAVWLVPASPYENEAGALAAVRFARETRRPFLGTCGGFQHAVIEFARNVAGLAHADHAETNPSADTLVVTRLACSLVEQTNTLRLAPDSLLHAAYGRTPRRKAIAAITARPLNTAPPSSAPDSTSPPSMTRTKFAPPSFP